MKTRIKDIHQLKLSMKRTIFKNFCEFFTGKEEGRQELGYLSSIEIINEEDNFTGNFCEFTGKETKSI